MEMRACRLHISGYMYASWIALFFCICDNDEEPNYKLHNAMLFFMETETYLDPSSVSCFIELHESRYVQTLIWLEESRDSLSSSTIDVWQSAKQFAISSMLRLRLNALNS